MSRIGKFIELVENQADDRFCQFIGSEKDFAGRERQIPAWRSSDQLVPSGLVKVTESTSQVAENHG
jgi:hypothetical protein